METHLLDGLLARSLSLLGCALFLMPFYDALFLEGSSLRGLRKYQVWGVLGGALSALVLLNAVALNVAEAATGPSSLWRPELGPLAHSAFAVVVKTQFGSWWLFHSSLLVLGVFLPGSWEPLAAFLWAASLARMGHAGDFEVLEFWSLLQTAHTVAVVFWISALFWLAKNIFKEENKNQISFSKRFSTMMLGLMSFILLTGLLRALYLLQNRQEDLFSAPYIWVLGFKLFLVGGLLAAAFRVRSQYQKRLATLPGSESFKNALSLELAFGTGVLCVSALLSQLPSP